MKSLLRNQRFKDGCTLLVVCVGLLVFWLRSFTVSDELLIESWGGDDSYYLCSWDQSIQLVHRKSRRANSVRQETLAYVPFPVLILPTLALAAFRTFGAELRGHVSVTTADHADDLFAASRLTPLGHRGSDPLGRLVEQLPLLLRNSHHFLMGTPDKG